MLVLIPVRLFGTVLDYHGATYMTVSRELLIVYSSSRGQGGRLHPALGLQLRRTAGHITSCPLDVRHSSTMRFHLTYNSTYKLMRRPTSQNRSHLDGV